MRAPPDRLYPQESSVLSTGGHRSRSLPGSFVTKHGSESVAFRGGGEGGGELGGWGIDIEPHISARVCKLDFNALVFYFLLLSRCLPLFNCWPLTEPPKAVWREGGLETQALPVWGAPLCAVSACVCQVSRLLREGSVQSQGGLLSCDFISL